MANRRKDSELECDEGIDRQTPEYARGCADFWLGKKVIDNPYHLGYYGRLNWYAGFYDTRTAYNLREVFKRHRVLYP